VNPRRSFAAGTGLFIVLGFASLAWLAMQTTTVANFHDGPSYLVKARFTNIGQLKDRAPVKIAGVRIGSVQSIKLEPEKLDALVTLAIGKQYNEIPDDSSASVYTSGLLGDQYIAIQPGGSPDALKNGDEMILTQSALQLEDLIGKFLVNGSPAGKKGSSGDSASPPKSTTGGQ
jgi:phospholipid/cholesterol/gamma-HCH transport system substrate-binding protein